MEVAATLERMNAFDPQVSFTIERPDNDGYLPFLNTKVKIIGGQKEYTWYKKATSANILVHSRSAHPTFIKANVVRNLLRTKDKLCMASNETVERTVACILNDNGYNTSPATTWSPYSTADGVALVVPYVGDRPARAVKEVVKQSGLPVKLIFRSPPTLRDLLTSTRLYENKSPN